MSEYLSSNATFATTILNCTVGSIRTKEKNGNLQVYLRVATHTKIKGEEITNWHNVVVYGKLAVVFDSFVKKGDKLLIEGEVEKWEMEDSETKEIVTKTYIRANSMDFKSGAKINLIGFCGNKFRKNDDSPLYMDVKTTRKVYKDDEKIEKEDWHKVVFYGNLANRMEELHTLDKKIAIIGSVEVIEQENKDAKYNDEITIFRAHRAKFL